MWKKKKKKEKKTRSEYAIWNNGYLETKTASLPPLPRPNDDPAESLFKQVFKITKVISI